MPGPTNEKWKQISKEYLDYRQIPQYYGSIDGKHIRIQKLTSGGSLWYNYKEFKLLHLMVSVDANYVFTIIEVGAYGSENNNAVFQNSAVGQAFFRNNNILHNCLVYPKYKSLRKDTLDWSYV